MSSLGLKRALCSAAVALAVAWGPAAHASSAPAMSFEQRLARADRVVLATVASQRTETPEGDPRRALTVTTLRVREHLKGAAGPAEIEVAQLGGASGAWSLAVAGDASFSVNEQVVALLRCPAAPAPGSRLRCTLFGLGDGKLVTRTRGDGELEVLLPKSSPKSEAGAARTIAQVRAQLARVAGQGAREARSAPPVAQPVQQLHPAQVGGVPAAPKGTR